MEARRLVEVDGILVHLRPISAPTLAQSEARRNRKRRARGSPRQPISRITLHVPPLSRFSRDPPREPERGFAHFVVLALSAYCLLPTAFIFHLSSFILYVLRPHLKKSTHPKTHVEIGDFRVYNRNVEQVNRIPRLPHHRQQPTRNSNAASSSETLGGNPILLGFRSRLLFPGWFKRGVALSPTDASPVEGKALPAVLLVFCF